MNLPQSVSFDFKKVSDLICPNCKSKGLDIFYSVKSIPVHSCLLMSTREQALNYPKGDLRLGFCYQCGFVTNTLFDPQTNDYSIQYEETQGFSSHFNAFAKSLAQRIIDRYNIRNQTVLEIGCGKGDFLALMCQLGKNKGIGIDPAFVPQRNPSKGVDITFIQDLYSEKYMDIKADVVCCRHTLEHIAPTYDFMKLVRSTIGNNNNVLVFYELPDVFRVLQEGAFWDIYYEHCSYFAAGSLIRLFRSTGFTVDDLYLDYNDQYIMITAYPADLQVTEQSPIKDEMKQIISAFENFKTVCSQKLNYWKTLIERTIEEDRKIVIWGGGSKGVAFLTTLNIGDAIEYVVDINPFKQGKFMPGTGQKVVSPEFLVEYQPDKIIIMNPVYCHEIQKDLNRLNIQTQLLAV